MLYRNNQVKIAANMDTSIYLAQGLYRVWSPAAARKEYFQAIGQPAVLCNALRAKSRQPVRNPERGAGLQASVRLR